ncbi:P-loop containing nucleoside triphosphate hydrolase protein [Suillus clintonianus]|uniref:P-loop containing nucleoside triphosphate hydrolase protein n=1 Tax=Suillus clintonianus TaxID=1904413 RepID=UPI001B878181|nr:P-loop containing nucleoside triphosphate hydrolase protein [Suillus clintonianus]KAG2129787.1 P-loop containing nucleoside triphosphate hydrolase protein [Suillus clintonianus]
MSSYSDTYSKVPLSTVDNQCIYLKLKAQLVDHAAGGTLTEVQNRPRAPAVVQSTSRASSSTDVQTPPRARNIVIFGETGIGKSSVINAIAQQELAKASNDGPGCTLDSQRYPVDINGQSFVLIDTAGLDEGPKGIARVPTATAKKQLKSLLRELMKPGSSSGGIDLLVYCVRNTATSKAMIGNYNTFYSGACQKIPIVVVVTRLERDMESWWDLNKGKFNGMQFRDYACVTTLQGSPDNSDSINRRITESSDILRNLVVNNCLDPAVDGSWSTGPWCRSPSWSED